MHRLPRHRIALTMALFGMVAFVGASLALHVHMLRVVHVTCAEHGDTLEVLAGQGDQAWADLALPGQDVASLPSSGAHDNDCPLASILTPTVNAVDHAWFVFGPAPTATGSQGPQPARAPPLRWAPKTSPPTIG